MPRGVRDHAARRLAKLEAQQAALPESERLVNRKDWNKRVSKPVSVLVRQARKNSHDAFVTTMAARSVAAFDSVDAAEAMFQAGGKPFTCDLLRQFLEASALSRGGTLVDGVQSIRSLRGLILNLFGSAQASGNPVEREVKKNTLLWIDADMLPRGLTHRVARTKLTALPQDITSFLRRLFEPQFMCSLPTTRDPLLIALFICLMVDCGARPSEFLRPSMSEENRKAYTKEHPEKIFMWERVEVFAFPPLAGEQSVQLRARLTFQSIKDSGNKGYKLKVIPLRLLPPDLVAEDSLFWLLTLGLIDQVFVNVSTWADFDRLQPGPHGLSIPIKSHMMQKAVFRTANRALSSSSDRLINEDQMGAQTMNLYLHDLSRYSGLEHALLPNVLRRSAAYMLATTTTEEERAARMGHINKSQTYWSSYRNTTSTVDFQGLRHGLEQQPMATMSSVFLGQSPDRQPPQQVSEEGMEAVHQDEQLRSLLVQQTTVLDALLTEHGSFDSARAAGCEQYKEYKQLGDQYSKRKSHLVKVKYNDEYKQYFSKLGQPAPQLAAADLEASTRDDNEIEQLLNLDQVTDLDDVEVPIDPRLLLGEPEDAADSMDEDDISDGEASSAPDAVAAPDDTATSSGGEASASRSFAPRVIGLHTLVDEVPVMLYEQQPPGLDQTTLSGFFCDAFNHLHNADKFYPNQEPFPGTFDCRFCGEHLLDTSDNRAFASAHLHADICEVSAFANSVLDDARSKDSPESAITTCPLSTLETGTLCKSKLTGVPRAFMHHTRNHHRDSSQRYVCSSHAVPLHFDVQADLFTHAVVVHGAPLSTMQSHTPGGTLVVANFIYFCPFCQVYISRREELEHDHMATHTQDFANAIATRGPAGLWMFNKWLYPAFCPFCAYDTALRLVARMHQFGDLKSLLSHIAGHINELDVPVPCPATATTPEGLPQCHETALLDSVQMAAHLVKEHGLDLKVPKTTTLPDEPAEPEPKKSKKSQPESRTILGELDVNRAL